MQKKKRDEKDNSIKLLLSVSGKLTEITALDMRKYELINYYIQQNGTQKADFMTSISEKLEKDFTAAIEAEYKKRVPKAVREMYEGLLQTSAAFGGEEAAQAEEKPAESVAAVTVQAASGTDTNENS